MLNYKIQRCLLNPFRIKHYHEAEAVSDFLGISKNWQGTGHEDFSTLMLELHGEKDPDNYFQTHSGRKIFAECLEKTEAYGRWRTLWEAKITYNKLSIFEKLAYNLIMLYSKITRYPSRLMTYWNQGISNWLDYRVRIERYKKDVQREFDIRLDNERVLGQRIADLEEKIFKKKRSAKKKKLNKKKFRRISKKDVGPPPLNE